MQDCVCPVTMQTQERPWGKGGAGRGEVIQSLLFEKIKSIRERGGTEPSMLTTQEEANHNCFTSLWEQDIEKNK